MTERDSSRGRRMRLIFAAVFAGLLQMPSGSCQDTATILTIDDLKRATYIVPSEVNKSEKRVNMTLGKAEYGDNEKLTFMHAAFGDLNGDNKPDAIVHFMHKHGQEITSHYLEFFLNSQGRPLPINVVRIGKNLYLDSLLVNENGTALLTYPLDGRTSAKKEYRVVAGVLKEVNAVYFNPFEKQKDTERETQQILKRTKDVQTAFDKVFTQLKQTLSPALLEVFDQTERTWVKYRDLHAQTVLAIRGLEPNSPDGINTRRLESIRLTQVRIEQMKKLLSRISPTEPLASSRYKFSDAMLNTTYTKLRERLSPEQKDILKLTELAWIAYRDQATNLRAHVLDIPPHAPEREACMYELAKQRTTELNDLCRQISLHTRVPTKSNSN